MDIFKSQISLVVEHYKKTKSVYTEDPLRPNELKITGSGKVHDLATKVSGLLKVGLGIFV